VKPFIFIAVCLLCICGPAAASDFPAAVEQPIRDSIDVRQKTQKAEDTWAREKAKLEAAYDALKNEQAQLLSLQKDLNKQISSQESAIVSLETKMNEISRISEELMPYLEGTYVRFNHLVEDDLPFLMEERKGRTGNMLNVLNDTQVTTSEKFRKMMEALLIEAEYGNTVEVYQERILIEGKDILVNIFRLGRISLFFQSLDKTLTGYYNQAQSVWTVLHESFNREIIAAIDIGMKRRSVDILNLPVGRIVSK
jgi:Protein of unknown function (DUF3450)